MAQDLIFSPAEKQVMAPFLACLTPERIAGQKELVINKPHQVGYEAFDGSWSFADAPELGKDVLNQVMSLIADRTGQTFNIANPILSVKLPGGHRAQFVAGEQNIAGFSLCIRLHQERQFGFDDYKMSEQDKTDIVDAVRNKKTLLISGGTGSGKTTFMNAIIAYIPETDRLVTLEDVAELKVPQGNKCAFLFSNFAKSGGQKQSSAINDLLNACLRMRPDRILLGEIRKENAFTFCSAINTGHRGSMATVHANDPKSAIDAVINRAMLNGDVTDAVLDIMRRQLTSDIYGVVQLTREKDGVHAYFEVLNKVPAKTTNLDQ